MNSHQGFSRIKHQRWKAKNQAVGQQYTSAIPTEQCSHAQLDNKDNNNRQSVDYSAGRQLTYADAAATNKEQSITTYKSAIFHTVDRDNVYPYPRPAKSGYSCTVQYIGEMGLGICGVGTWGWESGRLDGEDMCFGLRETREREDR